MLQAGSPVEGIQDANDECISRTLMFLSLSFSLPSPPSKVKKKKKKERKRKGRKGREGREREGKGGVAKCLMFPVAQFEKKSFSRMV